MKAHGRASPVASRRAVIAAPLALLASHVARAGDSELERKTIAVAKREAGLAAPLTLAMARVVLRPGASSWATIDGGVRLIAVESGVLGITAESPYRALITAAELTDSSAPPEPVEEILLPAGTVVTFAARGVASVRNPGARSAVVLDAVVFHDEPRPLARAFTTESGVSFQLLASASANAAPPGKVAVSLERWRLGRESVLPDELSVGLTLSYIEAGALDLIARNGEVYAARAAASAPYAAPGAMQLIAAGDKRGLTAGGVIFLSHGAGAEIAVGRRSAEMLSLSVRAAD
jgi:hypothetical protein